MIFLDRDIHEAHFQYFACVFDLIPKRLDELAVVRLIEVSDEGRILRRIISAKHHECSDVFLNQNN
jgi:hypothetical protein